MMAMNLHVMVFQTLLKVKKLFFSLLMKVIIDGKETEEKPLGWEDIKEMQKGEIHRTIQDDTMPNGPIERTIIYKALFAKCDREKDYEVVWVEFEKRGVNQ